MTTAAKQRAEALLAELERLNVSLVAVGDDLAVKSRRPLSDQLWQRLFEQKPALLKIAPRWRWLVLPSKGGPFFVECERFPMTAQDIRSAFGPGATVWPADRHSAYRMGENYGKAV